MKILPKNFTEMHTQLPNLNALEGTKYLVCGVEKIKASTLHRRSSGEKIYVSNINKLLLHTW